MKDNIITQKSFNFSVRIVKLSKFLREKHREKTLSNQILRSGTSVGANLIEAYNAESTPDFIHKFSIAQKECGETIYWLRLLHATDYLDKIMFESIHSDCDEIYRLVTSTLISKKKKR